MKNWLIPHLKFLKHSNSKDFKTVVDDTEFCDSPDVVKVSKMKDLLQGTNCRLKFTDVALSTILNTIN